MTDEDALNILLDTLTVSQKTQRENRSQLPLEDMLKLVWEYESQNLVQRHLGMSLNHSTITQFIQKVTKWEVSKQLTQGASLKKKLIAVAHELETKKPVTNPLPVCSEKVRERIYDLQNSMRMVSLDILKKHNLIGNDEMRMVEAMACQAMEIK